MKFQSVHWTEGMFLRPQHFQAADRHWIEYISTSNRFDNAYNYGLRGIELSEEALGNHQVEIRRCHARTKEGAIIDLVAGQELDRLDLTTAFDQEDQVTVYLAIPKLKLGRSNLGERFVESTLSDVPDESAGGNEQEISFRELNVQLRLSADDLQGYETLPIARIKRTGGDEALPVVDDEYIPPVLAIDAWGPLGGDIVRGIYDFIGQKVELFSKRIVDKGVSLGTQDAADLEELLKLIILNEAYSVLACLAFAQTVHPFTAYTELCRVVGSLSVFHESRRAPEIPKYDHDDLATIFRWVEVRIRELLGFGGPQLAEYEQRYFEGRSLGMRVAIKSEWLHSGWEWYVGVKGGNLSQDEVRNLLKEGQLDWKMGSDRRVDMIFQYAIPDVDHTEVPSPPSALPRHHGWIFYAIRRDAANQAWNDVVGEETLALRFADHLIANPEKLPGQRKLELTLKTKSAEMEFALFAMPPRQPK